MSPAEYKSYEDVKKRLDYTLGLKGSSKVQDAEVEDEDDYRGTAPSLTEDLRSELNNLKPSKSVSSDDEDEDDTLSYFARLAEE